MDPANWQQSVQSAMRFLITLSETKIVVQIYIYIYIYIHKTMLIAVGTR